VRHGKTECRFSKDYTECPYVARPSVAFAICGERFRRKIVRCRAARHRAVCRIAKAQVNEHVAPEVGIVAVARHDVGGLDIAVRISGLVQVGEGFANVECDPERPLRG
jgi:hypothetical protein